MFTVKQIEEAHHKVKSGADFPQYIKEIKNFGVEKFETFVTDSHTNYFGKNDFKTSSEPQYENLYISDNYNSTEFESQLKKHQKGETDYFTFCKDCAENGVEKWVMNLIDLTCSYYDKSGRIVLVEKIPT